jgi:uncharacterized protein (DUF433 family)
MQRGPIARVKESTRQEMVKKYEQGQRIVDIAKDYPEFKYQDVWRIINRNKECAPERRPLTETEKQEIQRRRQSGETRYQIAKDYPYVSQSTIYRVCE